MKATTSPVARERPVFRRVGTVGVRSTGTKTHEENSLAIISRRLGDGSPTTMISIGTPERDRSSTSDCRQARRSATSFHAATTTDSDGAVLGAVIDDHERRVPLLESASRDSGA